MIRDTDSFRLSYNNDCLDARCVCVRHFTIFSQNTILTIRTSAISYFDLASSYYRRDFNLFSSFILLKEEKEVSVTV